MNYQVEHIDANETVGYELLKITHADSSPRGSHDDSVCVIESLTCVTSAGKAVGMQQL